MSSRRKLVMLLLLGGLLVVLPTFSGATFTDTSTTPASVTAANDWTPPTVSVTSPGAVVNGTVSISATAADDRSAVASVVLEYAAAGSNSWTALCTDTTSPFSCTWNTTALSDGNYELRARATDTVGIEATSDTVVTRVANSVTVVVSESLDPVRGSVPLTATVLNAPASVVTSLKLQYLNASSVWTTFAGCSNTGSTALACSWATTGADVYDVRAIAVLGSTTYTDVTTYEVDNFAPTVTLTVPTGTLFGTVDLTATAADADTAVETVLFEYRRTGATAWTTCVLDDTDPFSCQLATGPLANGSYEFRATATDSAGNTTVTAVATRSVDNTVASTSITSPAAGTTVRGVVAVTAAASSSQGVTSVRIDARLAGGTFAAVCTDTTSPYTCSVDTTGIASGQYEIRSVMTQGNGVTVTSATVTVTLDNTPLRAQDVQATNVGTSGKVNSGDKVTLTYSTLVDLTTIKAGWNGSATAMNANLRDKRLTGATSDRLEFTGANLGQVSFAQNYIGRNKETSIPSSMTATTATVGGVQVTVVTITLGPPTTTANLSTSTGSGAMQWTPSSAAKSLGGAACSTATATESGTSDKDL